MLYLHGIGTFYPENIISNDFLEKLDIGGNSKWIKKRVGIDNTDFDFPSLSKSAKTKTKDFIIRIGYK
ncbi:MAG: hypothetical protein HYU69_11735 [Bacteroidetes bacterium]|nr:hypothetical protein [Bacteroidota bacterium]